MKAFIIHKAEGWHNVGSLLLLFREFGYKCWFTPKQILNYDSLKLYNPQIEQEIEVDEDIEELTRIGIYHKKYELLKYKKGAKL